MLMLNINICVSVTVFMSGCLSGCMMISDRCVTLVVLVSLIECVKRTDCKCVGKGRYVNVRYLNVIQ